MQIIWCGTCVPIKIGEKMRYSSPAANQYQHFFINALKKYGNIKKHSYVGHPVEKEQLEALSSISNVLQDCYTVKGKSPLKAIFNFRKHLKESLERSDMIFAYNVIYPWLGLPKMTHKYNKQCILILADHTPSSEYKNLIKRWIAKQSEKDFTNYDVIVALSKKMYEKLSYQNKVILMEGGVCLEKFSDFTPPIVKDKIRIMYSGLLSKVTGVDMLIEAIGQIEDPNIVFCITGKGELEDEILKLRDQDKRVEYHGYVEYEQYLLLLKQAHIFINPRNMNLVENQNNFPSKIMDYLAAGRGIVSTQFQGSDKFKDLINFVDSTTQEIKDGIQQGIKQLEQSSQAEFERNTAFSKQFDWDFQMTKLIEYIKQSEKLK